MIGHWWLYGRKWPSSLSQKEYGFPQYRRSPINFKFSQPLATRYKRKLAPDIDGGGGLYTPWEIGIQRQTTKKLLVQGTKSEKRQKLQSESFFLVEIHIHYFYTYWEFSRPTWKITYTQSANSHPKFQYDLSPYYINLLKNGSIPPFHYPAGRGCKLWNPCGYVNVYF